MGCRPDSLGPVNDSPVRVGLLGCGTVGSSLISLLQRQNSLIGARTGLDIVVAAVAVRDVSRPRPEAIAEALLTTDAA